MPVVEGDFDNPRRTTTRRRRSKVRSTKTRKIARQEAKRVLMKQAETKHWYGRVASTPDWDGIEYAITSDPVAATTITQGTGRNQYIGDTIRPLRLIVRYIFHIASLATFHTIRVLLVQVRGGGTPSPVNVLQSVSNQATPFSFIDPIYADTFRVLASRIHRIDDDNASAMGSITIPAKKMRTIEFANTTGGISASGIYLIVYGDDASGIPLMARWSLAYKDV